MVVLVAVVVIKDKADARVCLDAVKTCFMRS